MRGFSFVVRFCPVVVMAIGLGACNTMTRLSEVGKRPSLAEIENPADARPQVAFPMPPPAVNDRQANSLWRQGARAFFKDQRASQAGDILTVTINIADTATLSNQSVRARTNSERANTTNLLGYEQRLWEHLPGANKGSRGATGLDPANLINLGSTASSDGRGTINRTETITLRIAAVVTQVLPNGNLVVQGSQEVRVNFEVRVLEIAGVIRPQDIRSDNQIPYDRVAEARISYGGRGQVSDVQQPRWGQQIYDIIWPF
ncbi:MAG: flagellar basal body L-ring protein FlgH [Pseudomonadota bacterium]